MTRSSERFMKRLAQLVAESSEADWKYVAERFGELSEIAHSLSSIAGPKKRTRKKVQSKPVSKPLHKPDLSRWHSLQVGKLASYLRARPELLSLPRLRMLASIAGVKSEMPPAKASAIDLIAQHLDTLPAEIQTDRINQIMVFLRRDGADQSDEFKRWVTLITKRDSP